MLLKRESNDQLPSRYTSSTKKLVPQHCQVTLTQWNDRIQENEQTEYAEPFPEYDLQVLNDKSEM